MDRTPKSGQKWKHFKGSEYEILGISNSNKIPLSPITYWAEHTETEEMVGVYHLKETITVVKPDGLTPILETLVIYFQPEKARVWARPIANFLETLGLDGTQYYRFQRIT